MNTLTPKFKRYDNVIVASGHKAVVQDLYMTTDKSVNIYEVRLFDGLRHVGDIIQSESELRAAQ